MSALESGSRHSDARLFGCVTEAWQAHHDELLGYLRHRLSDAEAAADMLHDLFVKAMLQGQGFCTLSNPRAWLFQVARNALVDRARTAHPHEPLAEDEIELAAPELSTLAPVDELAGCLSRCLADMSVDDAAVLRACDLGGQSQRDYAQAQGLSLPAVKARILRARQRLRDRLTDVCQVRLDDDGRVGGHVPRSPDRQDSARQD